MKVLESKKFTLETVSKHFEEWRSKKKKGERIPQQLWSESITLLSDHSLNRIARTLRLCPNDIKKHRDALTAQGGTTTPDSPAMTFIEIDQPLVGATAAHTPLMELERPDGLRLRIQPANGADVLALAARFMEV
jgi:hypothetical protein